MRKAISNSDFQEIQEVEVDSNVCYIKSTPKTENVKNLIASRMKEKFSDDAVREAILLKKLFYEKVSKNGDPPPPRGFMKVYFFNFAIFLKI